MKIFKICIFIAGIIIFFSALNVFARGKAQFPDSSSLQPPPFNVVKGVIPPNNDNPQNKNKNEQDYSVPPVLNQADSDLKAKSAKINFVLYLSSYY